MNPQVLIERGDFMGFRLKTSKKTQEIFEEIGKSSNLKPFALSKIAISLSLKEKENIDNYINEDVNGIELQRSTITGEHDAIFKALIETKSKRHLSEDEYCPLYLKKHIDRGAEILDKNYEYAGGSLQKFLNYILRNKTGI